MNAYSINSNPYSLNTAYSNYGNYGGYSNANLGQNTSANFATPVDSFAGLPQDSVILSSAGNGNYNFNVTDVCECQFGNGASQEAFVVPAGDQDNPYQNFNATAMEVPAIQGQTPEQALLQLLGMLGFTPEMLKALQAQGINVLDLIAQANDMDNFGGLQTGQELVLPTTIPATTDAPAPVYMPVSTGNASANNDRPATNNAPAPVAQAAPAPAPAPAPPKAHNKPRGHRGGGRNVPIAV